MRRAVLLLATVAIGACGRGHPLAGDAAVGGRGGTTGIGGQGGAGSGASGTGDGGAIDARNPATTTDGRCVSGAYAHDGVCACQDVIPDVCGEVCVSLQTDDLNCGACGHVCDPTSTCQDGVCGPVPTTVAPAQPGCRGLHLAADGFRFYWTDTSARKVLAMNEGATTVQTLADQLVSPTLIATGGGKVAWFDDGKKAIEVSLGPDLIGVPAQLPAIRGLAVSDDGTTIYYSLGNSVVAVPTMGGAPTTLVTEKTGEPRGLATEGNFLVFTEDLNGFVLALTLVPGQMSDCSPQDSQGLYLPPVNCLRVAQGQGSLFVDAIALRGGRAVFADGINLKTSLVTEGKALNNSILSSRPDENISGLAATGDSAYFADESGVIYKAPLAGGATVRLARGQKGARSLAVTALRVLWTTDDCAIQGAPL